MSTLAVILIVVAGVLLAGAVIVAISCAVIAGRADELLERAYEQDPPAGSVQAEVVPFPRRPNGGGWAA